MDLKYRELISSREDVSEGELNNIIWHFGSEKALCKMTPPYLADSFPLCEQDHVP